jgi:hypothetical protein
MCNSDDNSTEGDIRTIPPGEVMDRWANGESALQIARETGQPVKIIYAILKENQKAIYHQRHRISTP